ncbi:MAG: ABC transporter substrate-binding protein [Clostridia bacterium]|nr:ABC transporter substrate-binding protein [Clostridia bacterium]
MKKVLALILVAVLCLGCFAACGGSGDDTTTTTNATTDATTDGTTDGTTENTNAAYDLTKVGEYTANNTEFVIGATGPLTGDAASYGISVQQGAQLAIDEINAAGGLNGIKFKFDMKDDKATAADASTGYDALYEAGMQVSLGSVTSGSAESFATRADEDGVFSLTPSASADPVINASDYAFRVCFGDPDNGILSAVKLTEKYEKIGVIYDSSDPYSTGIYDAFKAKMKELNATYLEQSFDAENNRDFSTQIEALKDCDVIFLPIYYTEAGLIAKTCVAKGCDAFLFGCDGLDGVAAQIDSTVTNKISYITPFDVNSKDAKVSAFVKAYEAKYNAKPDQFAADGYDAVYAIFEAMKALGVENVKVDPAELGKALASVFTADTFAYGGVTGNMKWEASGACNKEPNVVEIN